MRIDHIAIWVKDIEQIKTFYQHYFNMECGEKYENRRKGFTSYFLSFKEGARIEIMHRKDIKQGSENYNTYGVTHISVSVGSKEKVNELTESIRKDGYQIVGEPRTTGDGYYESVIADPEGNHIEITE